MSDRRSRRQFLTMATAAAAATLVSSRFGSSVARASSPPPPLRLICVMSPYQMSEPYFHPWTSASSSAKAPAGGSFFLEFPNSILAPLAPYQNDLIIIRGLKYGQSPGSHDSPATAFTGTPILTPGGDWHTTGTSIDNYLYSRMGHQGSLTPICASIFNPPGISWLSGIESAVSLNPRDVHRALFEHFTAPDNGDAAAAAAAAALAARRKQSLDVAQKQLQRLMTRLPTGTSKSAAALQSHLASAQGLAGQLGRTGPTAAACVPPTLASITDDPGLPPGTNGPLENPALAGPDMTSFIQLITQAFACDITRFASLGMSECHQNERQFINSIPGLESWSGNDFHGEVTHGTSGEMSNPLDLTCAQFKRYFMTHVASLLAALKSVADPFNPAQTLYDNTVVLIGNEGPVQAPNTDPHNNGTTDQTFILAGGCGGYFKRGQLVFAGGSTSPSVNNSALLANVINAFELNQQQFNPAYTPQMLTGFGDYPFSVSATNWLA